jgi:hypothetical protein
MGYITKLFALSQKIIVDNNRNAPFAQAYNLSYADIWDFSSEKKSLKKFEIDLGIHHMELDFHGMSPLMRKTGREWWIIVSTMLKLLKLYLKIVGLIFLLVRFWRNSVRTDQLTILPSVILRRSYLVMIRIPRKSFVYTDLSKEFPGYKFELGKSSYRGEEPGEGGYVYAEPGIYSDVALLDIASMHPATIERLNLFGKYTERFSELKRARIHIKRRDFEALGKSSKDD